MNRHYTVWVGGSEVSDCLLTKQDAEELASTYIEQGYTDVSVEKIEDFLYYGDDDSRAE